MNIIKFFKDHDLNRTIEIKEGNSCYEDSSTAVLYIRLNKALESGQMHLVLSRSLAEDIIAGKLTIKDAEVSSNDGVYGLIRPDTCKVIDTVDLW